MDVHNHVSNVNVAALIADIEQARLVRADARNTQETAVKPKLADFKAEMKEVWEEHAVESKQARRHLEAMLDMEPDELARYARVMIPIFEHIKATKMTDALRDLVDIMQEGDGQ